jgi:hypothetical protein
MCAKAAVYPAQGRSSTTCMTRTDPLMKTKKKLDRTAEKNTLNGISAKNRDLRKVNEPFSLALTLFIINYSGNL